MAKKKRSAPAPTAEVLEAWKGRWSGKAKTWFEPGVLADSSEWKGSLRIALKGFSFVHEYRSKVLGRPHRGIAVVTIDPERRRVTHAWTDTFHMHAELMFSEGEWSGKGFSVLGSYPAGDGPRWGWRTTYELGRSGKLTLTMFNITPDGQEAKAVEAVFSRS